MIVFQTTGITEHHIPQNYQNSVYLLADTFDVIIVVSILMVILH